MSKMIKVMTQGPDGKPTMATLPVMAILQNPKNIRMDGLMDACRFAILDAHQQIREIHQLLLNIAESAGAAAPPRKLRESAPILSDGEGTTPGTDGAII